MSPDSAKKEGGRQTRFIITGRDAQVTQALDGVVKRLKVPINSVALAYIMQKSRYIFLVLGGREVEYLTDNIEALSLQISPQDVADFKKRAMLLIKASR